MDNKEYNNLINKYNKCENEIDFYNIRIEELEKHEDVIEYLKYKKLVKDTTKKQNKLYKKRKLLEYSMCNHVIVCSKLEHKEIKYREHTCILCGLTDAVVKKEKDDLTISDKIMLKYLSENALRGEYLDVVCDPNVANDIWFKTKKKYSYVTDKELIEIFKEALNENKQDKVKIKK